MAPTHHAIQRLRHLVMAVCGFRRAPIPRAAMLRSGGAICSGFVLFLVFGRPGAAILCAFFTNFLCLADRAEHVSTRVWVQAIGGLAFLLLGALGLVLAGSLPLILVAVFAAALVAGFVHGSSPGLEAVPRFGLCCLVVAAFIPVDKADSLAAAFVGTAISVATVLLDDAIRRGRRGEYIQQVNANAAYAGPRFSLLYGCAAAGGLALGVLWGGLRPYWVTVTTLLVMQPDRRANTVRVAQRFVGTLAGVVFAFCAVRALPDALRARGLLTMVVTLPFLWPLGFDRNYALGTAMLSAWVLVLIDTALPSADLVTALFYARLSDTAIGCAVALAGSFVVIEAQHTS